MSSRTETYRCPACASPMLPQPSTGYHCPLCQTLVLLRDDGDIHIVPPQGHVKRLSWASLEPCRGCR